ncbi:FadR/GntR family transcriptional regulator [Sphingobium sp. Sx8-8]|uniref:FadR/GntR family transcriptional regulator n=1 Tax=Sphingobium sp. Sx8-8 TaxID=2933617 RepID=UPI001F583987|nr:FadR/GntR family transcriptional regulator [Sphingobium sp. Sx8-8]
MDDPRTRLYEKVAASLAGRISSGEYRIGGRLPSERELATSFEVSRPTVREAIIALELDGFVEVRKGAGVYVVSHVPRNGVRSATDVGPFEHLDARRAIEGEACALAAARITDAQIRDLEAILRVMHAGTDFDSAEAADRDFHLGIAEATGNSVIIDVVNQLWQARERSPQYQLLAQKAHEAKIGPVIEEHRRILDALKRKDGEGARAVMRDHLSRVMDTMLAVTEVHEIEQARARLMKERHKYSSESRSAAG